MYEDKVIIITGSTRGIGKSIAERLAMEGASIVVNGRDRDRVEAVVQDLKKHHSRIIGISTSVATISGCKQVVDGALAEFGKIDALINNAGIVRDRISYKMTEEEWDDVIETHLKGTFGCTKYTVLAMKERQTGGVIINLTSKSGMEGLAGQLNYSAAKAGIGGMTWTLAKELKRFGIVVYGVAPVAETDMTKPVIEWILEESRKKGKPFPSDWKMGTPDDVATLISTLLSERPDSGSIYSVNGNRLGIWEPPKHHTLDLSGNEGKYDNIIRSFNGKTQ
ncbi:SDR family NAD(P)-dependent oxidoreductase [Pseudalkalibacillus decolorationis]|uniref:SDR family NAD(P)-dependent oxidoreductase n=1 Tax=Pseudalkalibacillus decolorationis TaxID=163879 RepID=UPI00214806A0|nr:SDR family NAD(P)-dependent oxidoreductase [Pseudalkalibacillus decolorationis]